MRRVLIDTKKLKEISVKSRPIGMAYAPWRAPLGEDEQVQRGVRDKPAGDRRSLVRSQVREEE